MGSGEKQKNSGRINCFLINTQPVQDKSEKQHRKFNTRNIAGEERDDRTMPDTSIKRTRHSETCTLEMRMRDALMDRRLNGDTRSYKSFSQKLHRDISLVHQSRYERQVMDERYTVPRSVGRPYH